MMHRILPGWIVAAVLGLPSAIAAAETYLLVPGVTGDSVAKGHEGWIRIARLDWEVEAESSWKNTGPSVGRPNPGRIILKLATGPWSSAFLGAITSGTLLDHGNSIFIDHLASDGRVIVRLKITSLYVTKYGLAASSPEYPQDLFEGTFKTLHFEFYNPGIDSKLAPTGADWDVQTGAAGAIVK